MAAYRISVITVCRDDVQALKVTVRSVQEQGVPWVEHVVIDGGSSDGTMELLQETAADDRRLRYVSEPDEGIYDAINKGVRLSAGEYILVLNAGDIFASTSALQELFGFYAIGDFFVGRVKYRKKNKVLKEDRGEFPSKHTLECSHQAFVYKRTLHEDLGPYSLRYRSAGDYEFFCRVFRKYGNPYSGGKEDLFISIRDKERPGSADSVAHSWEMLCIDYEYGVFFRTFGRRVWEILRKSGKQLLRR